MSVVRISHEDDERTREAKLKEIEKAKQSLKATREAIKSATNPDH